MQPATGPLGDDPPVDMDDGLPHDGPNIVVAASRAEVEVEVQTHPVLEDLVNNLQTQNNELHHQVSQLQFALYGTRQESLQNLHAAMTANDDNALVGLVGGRCIHEYREEGMQLERKLNESRGAIRQAELVNDRARRKDKKLCGSLCC